MESHLVAINLSSAAALGRRNLDASVARCAEQNEPGCPADRFLSRASASHAASRSTRTGLGSSSLERRWARVVAGQAQRGQKPERDGLAVREVVPGRGLERVARTCGRG